MAAEIHSLNSRKNIGKAAGLLRSLVPRAQVFCFYDLERRCVWSSDGADDYEIDAFIAELPDEIVAASQGGEEPVKRTLSSGRTLLLLPVYGNEQDLLGMLVCLFSKILH